MKPTRILHALVRAGAASLRWVWESLCVYGRSIELAAGVTPYRHRGPPPTHPERPAGHIPPTPVERRLWSQLDDRADKGER
ncbi:hypothetical protein AWW66_01160 [Micromonospora rosaria]|uniref:Uncharacterized protein n=1 Tax=Micromonospora rosaria TaxID=47874 RepID=A0A136PZE6_9ACTN|nr:DUF6059 family protein [Micromonospora rosaria]KXK63819.1 hypothetical protein AWW66_01160 [Micromonospora rosaria]